MIIRSKVPDPKNAHSIVEAAKSNMEYTLTLKPTEESGSTIVRNIYECLRMLGDALLVSRGLKTENHEAQINELIVLKVKTTRPVELLENLKRLRHNINYYGYRPNLPEVEDAISIAKSCFEPLYKEILLIIGKK